MLESIWRADWERKSIAERQAFADSLTEQAGDGDDQVDAEESLDILCEMASAASAAAGSAGSSRDSAPRPSLGLAATLGSEQWPVSPELVAELMTQSRRGSKINCISNKLKHHEIALYGGKSSIEFDGSRSR